MKLQYTVTEENYRDFLAFETGNKPSISFAAIQKTIACLLALQIFITIMSSLINKWGLRVYDVRNFTLIPFLILIIGVSQFQQKDYVEKLLQRHKQERIIPEGFIGKHELVLGRDGFKEFFGTCCWEKSYSSIIDIVEHHYMIHLKFNRNNVVIPYQAFSSEEEKNEFLSFIKEKKRLFKHTGFHLEEKLRENPERPEEYYQFHLSQAEAAEMLRDAMRMFTIYKIKMSAAEIFYLVLSLWGIITMIFIPQIRTITLGADIWSGELFILISMLILDIPYINAFTPRISPALSRSLSSDGVNSHLTKPQWLLIRGNSLFIYQETYVQKTSLEEIAEVKWNRQVFCIILRNHSIIPLPRGLFPSADQCAAFRQRLMTGSKANAATS